MTKLEKLRSKGWIITRALSTGNLVATKGSLTYAGGSIAILYNQITAKITRL